MLRTRLLLPIFAACLLLLPASVVAQTPVVETEPAIPTVLEPVTVFFNADQGNQGLQDFTGTVYAHTGIYTSESPAEWKCVKNYWPTEPDFAGERDDVVLEQVSANRYKLTIDDIRAYYQDTSTACTLAEDETVESINFVFRNGEGTLEGKTEGGGDIIVELGSADPGVNVSIESPLVSPINPLVTNTDQTVQVTAAANAIGTSLESLTLFANGVEQARTETASELTYELSLTSPGRTDIRVEARGADGSVAADSFYAVRTEPTTEAAVPGNIRDGITEGASTVTFVLEAPGKEFVHLIGDFTDWEVRPDYQMNRASGTTSGGQRSDRFWIQIGTDSLQSGVEYGFQYLVDGEIRIADPYSEKVLSTNDQFISDETYPDLKPYPTGQTEQLVGVFELGKPAFNFSDFTRPEQKDLVIYELLVRDFIEKHDYQTMQDTLAYLDRMGINAIELMPVSEFDGNQSWGYNPAMYFAPDKYYGPEEELKRFIDAAHQRGMAVILDVVYNQATGQSPFVRLDNDGTFGAPTTTNPWVNREARHPFNVFYDNNHESDLTKRWLDRANEHWLTEYNVDGFRFDLSKGFTQTNTGSDVGQWGQYDQSRVDILTRMADEIWSIDDRAYVILEHFAAQDEEKALAEYRTGDGLPGMMLWNNVHGPYNQSSMGYADGSDFSNSYYRNRGIDVPNYVTYMESHDEQWMMFNNIANGNAAPDGSYDVTNLETALNRQKLAGAFFFTVPGPRMMWQFGELGYGYGEDGTQCLQPSDDCPAGTPGRTDVKPVRWDYRNPGQSPNRVQLYKTWSALINLRQSNEVFRATDTNVVMRVGSGTLGKRILLDDPAADGMDVLVIGNFDVVPQDVSANFPSNGQPVRAWYDFFTGEEINIQTEEQDQPLSLAPGQFHIFTTQPVETPEAGIVPFGLTAPVPAAPSNLQADSDLEAETITLSWTASTAPDVVRHKVYRGTSAGFDTTGAQVATLPGDATSYPDPDASRGDVFFYRVVVEDDDQQRAVTDEVDGLLYPQDISVGVSRSFGQGTRSQDYRLVALPGDVNTDAGSTFSGTAGEDWQLYRDNGASQDFLVPYASGNSSFAFRPGSGFWAIATDDWSVTETVSTVQVRSLSTGGVGTLITLNDGWNIISNPFDLNVPWSVIQDANDTAQPLWGFNGAFQQEQTLTSAQEGEAFYFNNTAGLSALRIPYTTATASSAAKSDGTSFLTLTAETDEGLTSVVEVGTEASATEGRGAEDIAAPTARFAAVSFGVEAQPEEGGQIDARQQTLARSVRPPASDGHVFPLRLTAADGAPVTVRASGLSAFAGAEVRLVDTRTGETFDLRRTPTARVHPTDDGTALSLLVGTPAFVNAQQERMVPETLTLWPNYPNPFRGETTLEYTIPDDGHVTLEVYDVLGRRVGILVDRRQTAGLHRVPFNSNGRSLSSGLYLTRITFNGDTRTRKMMLVR